MGGPKHGCAYTKEHACNYVESLDVVFVVRIEQDANGVDAIANTTKGQCQLDTKPVDERASKEADNSKGAV